MPTIAQDLIPHIGHQVAIVTYRGRDGLPENLALECEECAVVIADFPYEPQA